MCVWITAATSGGAGFQQRTEDLFMLSTRLLNDTNGSRQRKRKVQANIKRYRQGCLEDPKPLRPAKRRSAEQRIVRQVHKQLQRGNISRATRALEAAEVADATPEVMEMLQELHPAAAPPEVDAREAVPVQITREQLQKVLKRLPRGSAPGPSAWTFEHIQAVAESTTEGMDAVLA